MKEFACLLLVQWCTWFQYLYDSVDELSNANLTQSHKELPCNHLSSSELKIWKYNFAIQHLICWSWTPLLQVIEFQTDLVTDFFWFVCRRLWKKYSVKRRHNLKLTNVLLISNSYEYNYMGLSRLVEEFASQKCIILFICWILMFIFLN